MTEINDTDPQTAPSSNDQRVLSDEEQAEIANLRERLSIYRRTLNHYLTQEAALGSAYVPPAIMNGIHETRQNIAKIKKALGQFGIPVNDDPDDTDHEPDPWIATKRPLRKKGLHRNSVALVVSGGLLLVIIGLLVYRHYSLAAPTVQPVSSGKYMVLVSQISADSTNSDVTQQISQNLTRTFERDLPLSQLQVRSYPVEIQSYQQAVEVAEQTQAAVIVWGKVNDLNIQVGSLVPFKGLIFDRATLDRTANIRVSVADPQRMSVAPYVLGVFQVLQIAQGQSLAIARNADLMDQIKGNILKGNIPEIIDQNSAAFFHRGFQNHFSNPEQAVNDYSSAIDAQPNALLHVFRGATLNRLGKFDQAGDDARAASELVPNEQWTPPLYLDIVGKLYTREYTQALNIADQVIEVQPDDWLAVLTRGSIRFMLADYSQARVDLQQSIELSPTSSLPYQMLALVALHEGKIAEAQQLITTGKQKYPDAAAINRLFVGLFGAQPNPLRTLSQSFNEMLVGRFNNAIQTTKDGIEKDSTAVDMYMIQGISQCVLQQYADAEASYSAAIERNPDFPLLYLLRAEVRTKQQKTIEALSDINVLNQSSQAAQIQPYIKAFQQGSFSCETVFNP